MWWKLNLKWVNFVSIDWKSKISLFVFLLVEYDLLTIVYLIGISYNLNIVSYENQFVFVDDRLICIHSN